MRFTKWQYTILIISIVLLINANVYAKSFRSPLIRTDEITVSSDSDTYPLSSSPIMLNSEIVYQDTLTLIRDIDYLIDYSKGYITYLSPVIGLTEVEYTIFPKSLTESFFYYKKVVLSDSLDIKKIRPRRDLFHSSGNLIVSGSKTFSISVSRNKGVDLDQSLYLKLKGEISDNINIEAQLSDSESPISPEGNSKELSNLDEIYIRLYGKQYELSFGDLETEYKGTRFINYKSSYEGLKAIYDDKFRIGGSMAISKAKNAENSFSCIDGKQGPYYLSIEGVPYNLLIVPGSEAVYINGALGERGRNYTIDYSEGTITFEDIVTSNTDIRVTYQYSNEKYLQNLYLAENSIRLGDRFTLSTYLIAKVDDKNQPLEDEFSDSDKDALRIGGDGVVMVDGVSQELEPGSGLYIESPDGSYYVYSDSLGIYNISFTYVGIGLGSYSEIPPNVFEYSGDNLGEWKPLKELTAPESKYNIDMSAVYSGTFYKVKAETMVTGNDENTFSDIDDGDNTAWLGYAEASIYPDWNRVKPHLLFSASYQQKNRYTFADIINSADTYDLTYIPVTDDVAISEINSSLSFNFYEHFQPSLILKRKVGQSLFKQNYLRFNSQIKQWKQFIPSINYSLLLTDEEYENYL
ncbi:MAG: hypothetical protein P9L91_03930, partial [Candidatus Zophobacter franzmannii]|nr:hypothetical protein [Candidatus Zophobacter franzmannii]